MKIAPLIPPSFMSPLTWECRICLTMSSAVQEWALTRLCFLLGYGIGVGGKGSVSFSAHISQICQYVVTIFSTQAAAGTPVSLPVFIADCFLGAWEPFLCAVSFSFGLGFVCFLIFILFIYFLNYFGFGFFFPFCARSRGFTRAGTNDPWWTHWDYGQPSICMRGSKKANYTANLRQRSFSSRFFRVTYWDLSKGWKVKLWAVLLSSTCEGREILCRHFNK